MARETRIRPWDSCEAWVIGFVELRSENDPTVYPTPLFLPSANRLLTFPFIGLALFIFAIILFLSSLKKKKNIKIFNLHRIEAESIFTRADALFFIVIYMQDLSSIVELLFMHIDRSVF